MTPFSALQSLCGLSNREAAAYLNVSESAVERWNRAAGVKSARPAPQGALDDLLNLWTLIDNAAVDSAERIVAIGIEGLKDAAEIQIGYPADDHEAQQLGLPCVGAWRQMLARLIDELRLVYQDDFDLQRIKLVPRGSTPETAAAIDQHK